MRKNQPTASHWLQKWQSNGTTVSSRELLYYRQYPIRPPFRLNKGVSMLSGAQQSPWRGRGMDFSEVRHYQAGDDIRAIDWRVTARTGKTHTKLFMEEKERPVFVCVDYSASMHFGSELLFKAVFAAHVAAAIAWGTVKAGDRIGGLIFNGQSAREIKPQGRQQGVLNFIQTLVKSFPAADDNATHANTSDGSPQTLNHQLQRLLQLAHPGSDVFLISDFSQMNEASVALLKGLKRHSAVIALHISDPFEHALPTATVKLNATDGAEVAALHLDSPAFLRAYKEKSTALTQQQQAWFKQAGLPVVALSAATPLEQQWRFGATAALNTGIGKHGVNKS